MHYLRVAPMLIPLPNLGCSVDLERGLVDGPHGAVRLSSRERQLLAALHESAGDPVDRTTLAVRSGCADDRSVDFAIRGLRMKIEADPSAPRVVVTVRGHGYRLGLPRAMAPPAPPREHLTLEDRTVDVDLGTVQVLGSERSLTTYEREVLRLLYAADGGVVTRDRLAREVWGSRTALTTRRVDAVIHALRTAIEPVPSVPRVILTARGQGYRLSRERPRSNLGGPLDRLTGRQIELDTALSAVGEHRWVAVIGPPGIGKTALAAEVCRQLAASLPGGAWWVDCADQRTAAGVVRAALAVLGAAPSDDPRTLAGTLVRRPKMALVLDNLEQVSGIEELIVAVVRAASSVNLIGTSSRALAIPTGRTVVLSGLSVDAGRVLYLKLAEDSGAVVDPSQYDDVDRFVNAVDRLPLAIVLAAQMARVLPPGELAGTSPLELHGSPILHRHASLRATLDWTWQLATAQQREALVACQVFRAPFTLAALAEVSGAALPVVRDLVSRSFLTEVAATAGSPRYRLFGVMADYLAARRAPSEAVREAHARWFAARAADLDRRATANWWRTVGEVLPLSEDLEAASVHLASLDPEEAARIQVFLFGLWSGEVGGAGPVVDLLLDTRPVGAFPSRSKLWLCRWRRAIREGDLARSASALDAAIADGLDPLDWDYRRARREDDSYAGRVEPDPGPKPDDPAHEASWLLLVGLHQSRLGRRAHGAEWIERARLVARRRGDLADERTAEAAAASLMLESTAVPPESLALRFEALALSYEATGQPHMARHHLWIAGMCRYKSGNLARARELGQGVLDRARTLGHAHDELRAETLLLVIGVADDDPVEFVTRAAELLARAAAFEDRFSRGAAAFCLCVGLARSGDRAAACALADDQQAFVRPDVAVALQAIAGLVDPTRPPVSPVEDDGTSYAMVVNLVRHLRHGAPLATPTRRAMTRFPPLRAVRSLATPEHPADASAGG